MRPEQHIEERLNEAYRRRAMSRDMIDPMTDTTISELRWVLEL